MSGQFADLVLRDHGRCVNDDTAGSDAVDQHLQVSSTAGDFYSRQFCV